MKKWRQSFDVDEAIWNEYINQPNGVDETMLSWFLWVAKWFMHGLNGPFGTVLQIPKIFLPDQKGQMTVCCTEVFSVNNLFPNKNSIMFTQIDTWNCGVCCQFFF